MCAFVIVVHSITVSSYVDVGCNQPLVNNDNTTSDRAVVNKPDCLYGPQVIYVIMKKPGRMTIDLLQY